MAVNPPSFMLKSIWLVHFLLSSWAMLSGWIEVSTYFYTHVAVLAFGFWAVVDNENADAALMFFITLLISIINDIILLGIYEPRGHDLFESGAVSTSRRNEYRFALGMCIANLLLKPITAFLIFRVYQSRCTGSEFNSGFPSMGSSTSATGGGYDNIESAGSSPYKSNEPYQQPPTH